MGLVNSGIYVLAAFYQNTRTSDELRCLANCWRKFETFQKLQINFYRFSVILMWGIFQNYTIVLKRE